MHWTNASTSKGRRGVRPPEQLTFRLPAGSLNPIEGVAANHGTTFAKCGRPLIRPARDAAQKLKQVRPRVRPGSLPRPPQTRRRSVEGHGHEIASERRRGLPGHATTRGDG